MNRSTSSLPISALPATSMSLLCSSCSSLYWYLLGSRDPFSSFWTCNCSTSSIVYKQCIQTILIWITSLVKLGILCFFLEFHLFHKGFKLLILMFQAYHIDLQIAKCHYQTMSCLKFPLNEQTAKLRYVVCSKIKFYLVINPKPLYNERRKWASSHTSHSRIDWQCYTYWLTN